MSEMTWQRNTTGLVIDAQRRKERKRKGVEEAIATLLREQKPVNFNTVAKAATVSKAYLYNQPDLRERIEALRQQEVEQLVRERVIRERPQVGYDSWLGRTPSRSKPHHSSDTIATEPSLCLEYGPLMFGIIQF